MSERYPIQSVADAIDQLREESHQAWRQRDCLATATIWKAAFGLSEFGEDERRHLASCAHCQRRSDEVRQVARHPGLRVDPAARLLRADQLVRPGSAREVEPRSGPQRLTFAGEPDLAVCVTLEGADVRLRVEHGQWAAGTLLRVALDPPRGAGRSCRALALLQAAQPAVGEAVLRDTLVGEKAPRPLTVQTVLASQLAADETALLQAAWVDAGAGLAAWHAWARQALVLGNLQPAVQTALETLLRANPSRPTGKSR